jgi:hypothetical protein
MMPRTRLSNMTGSLSPLHIGHGCQAARAVQNHSSVQGIFRKAHSGGVRVHPHAVRPQSTALEMAIPHFARLITRTSPGAARPAVAPNIAATATPILLSMAGMNMSPP